MTSSELLLISLTFLLTTTQNCRGSEFEILCRYMPSPSRPGPGTAFIQNKWQVIDLFNQNDFSSGPFIRIDGSAWWLEWGDMLPKLTNCEAYRGVGIAVKVTLGDGEGSVVDLPQVDVTSQHVVENFGENIPEEGMAKMQTLKRPLKKCITIKLTFKNNLLGGLEIHSYTIKKMGNKVISVRPDINTSGNNVKSTFEEECVEEITGIKSRIIDEDEAQWSDTTVKSSTVKPSAVKPSAAKPSAVKPSAVKPSTVKPSAVKHSTVKPSNKTGVSVSKATLIAVVVVVVALLLVAIILTCLFVRNLRNAKDLRKMSTRDSVISGDFARVHSAQDGNTDGLNIYSYEDSIDLGGSRRVSQAYYENIEA